VANKDDPPRIRAWNLRLRKPTPHPLLCSSGSSRGHSQSQSPEIVIVSNCGSAPAQPPNSPPRFAANSKSPIVYFVAGAPLVLEHGGDRTAGSAWVSYSYGREFDLDSPHFSERLSFFSQALHILPRSCLFRFFPQAFRSAGV
jgi:hypothetical protein